MISTRDSCLLRFRTQYSNANKKLRSNLTLVNLKIRCCEKVPQRTEVTDIPDSWEIQICCCCHLVVQCKFHLLSKRCVRIHLNLSLYLKWYCRNNNNNRNSLVVRGQTVHVRRIDKTKHFETPVAKLFALSKINGYLTVSVWSITLASLII